MSYLCDNCKKSIPIEDKIKHELYCSSFKTNEYETLIPCEYCNEFIEFDNYNLHISQCNNSINLINLLENGLNNIIIPIPIQEPVEPVVPAPVPAKPIIPAPVPAIPVPAIPAIPAIPAPAIPAIPAPVPDLNSLNSILEQNINNINNFMNTMINNNNNDNGNGVIMDFNETNDNNYDYLINMGNTIGNVNNTIEDIDTISNKIESLTLIKCPICFKNNNNNRKTLCKHIFCESCLKTWIQNSKKCPICMINLDEIQK